MIQLFCKTKIDDGYFSKFNYVAKEMTIDSEINDKVNNRLVMMIDTEDEKIVTGLIINKNSSSEYNIKILSEIEKINSKDWEEIILDLQESDKIIEIKDKSIKIQTTLWIETITDYIAICSHLNDKNTLYRGQANEGWKLEPSVFRENVVENKESTIYKEILQWNIDTFTQDDLLQDVCNMQHYAIPTRLMDWTSNPLHALYFAVVDKNQKQENGLVIIVNIDTRRIVEINSDEYENLQDFLAKRYGLGNYNEEKNNLYLENIIDSKEKYIFLKAKYSNDRIKAQQGYFSIYRDITYEEALLIKQKRLKKIDENLKMYLKKKYHTERILSLDKRIDLKEENENTCIEKLIKEKFVDRLIVEFRLEEQDKKDLDEYIKESIRKSKITNCISKPNKMSEILENESYIKIMLGHEIKEDLMKNLELLGVNSKVIYPDIEGFAKYIKEKYN